MTVKAMLMPTQSVVHVVGFASHPEVYFENSVVKQVAIGQPYLQSFIRFVSNSFARGQSDQLIELNQGVYGDSLFYSGVGSYHAFNTCNKWTAKALYSGGIAMPPVLKLTASSIMNGLKHVKPSQGDKVY